MTTLLTYRHGDATVPATAAPTILVHCCNDVGAWGRGFVLAVSRRWTQPEAAYRRWPRPPTAAGGRFGLGAVQCVPVAPALWVANLIGQHGIRTTYSGPPIRYDALEQGLIGVCAFALAHQAVVQMPRIGCGLAGGTWDRIEPLLRRTLTVAGIAVTVYDFP